MNNSNRYYKSSGSFSPIGLAVTIIIGLVATGVLSLVYGYALAWIPFIYINFFVVLGYGFGVGAAVAFGGRIGKIRNTGIMMLMGLLFGLLAEFAGWVTWIYAMSSQELLILSPGGMLLAIQALAAEGVWNLKGWTPTGTALYIIWGIEAVMVIGLATVMGASSASDPFCERCSSWVDKKEAHGPFSVDSISEQLVEDLENEKYEALEELGTCHPTNCFVEAELNRCSECKQMHLLDLKIVTITVDDEGKAERKEQALMENLLISALAHELIKEAGAREPVEAEAEVEVEVEAVADEA